jgi:hypothetical protein
MHFLVRIPEPTHRFGARGAVSSSDWYPRRAADPLTTRFCAVVSAKRSSAARTNLPKRQAFSRELIASVALKIRSDTPSSCHMCLPAETHNTGRSPGTNTQLSP